MFAIFNAIDDSGSLQRVSQSFNGFRSRNSWNIACLFVYLKAKIARLINKSDFNTKRFWFVIALNNNKSSIRVLRRKNYFYVAESVAMQIMNGSLRFSQQKQILLSFLYKKCAVFENMHFFLWEIFRGIKLSNTYLSKLDSVRLRNPWLMDFKIG